MMAYRRTAYRVASHTLHIGQRLKSWPFAQDDLILIGACNPGGKAQDEGRNRRAMADLQHRLSSMTSKPCLGNGAGHAVLQGVGRWKRWCEPFFAVSIPVGKARGLGRLFGQNALVHVRRGQKARLIWLCDPKALPFREGR